MYDQGPPEAVMETKRHPILNIERLVKRFGNVQALKGIDIRLEGPGVYGFLGPNGAGKTTTFKVIGGLLRPTDGRVLVDGIDVFEDAPRAVSRLGVLFDAPAYYPYLSGRENLYVFNRWMGRDDREMVDPLLDLVGLGGSGERKVGEYSWGMKRRLGIASALLGDPTLLLLDEPTNGLDPAGIADMRKLLPRLAWEEGKSVLLSSHRMEEVSQICDHITIINGGEIVASGTPAELADQERWIEIESPDADSALSALRDSGMAERTVRRSAVRIDVMAPGRTASEVNALLVGKGIEVTGLREKRESLEEIFFRITGGGGDDG
jgi:ABC-2 type transport system ATP-binding protein